MVKKEKKQNVEKPKSSTELDECLNKLEIKMKNSKEVIKTEKQYVESVKSALYTLLNDDVPEDVKLKLLEKYLTGPHE